MQGCVTALGFRRCTPRVGATSRSGASAEPARPSSSWLWPRPSASVPWPRAPSPATTGPRVRPQLGRRRRRPRDTAATATITTGRGRRPPLSPQPCRSRHRHRLRPSPPRRPSSPVGAHDGAARDDLASARNLCNGRDRRAASPRGRCRGGAGRAGRDRCRLLALPRRCGAGGAQRVRRGARPRQPAAVRGARGCGRGRARHWRGGRSDRRRRVGSCRVRP